jgi:hypothetical protein
VDEQPFNEPTPEEETAGLRDRVFDARCCCGHYGRKKNLGKDLRGTIDPGRTRRCVVVPGRTSGRPTTQMILCQLYEYKYDIEKPRRG